MAWSTGEWAWSVAHDEPCRVIEVENLWDAAAVRVWLPTRDAVVRVPETGLRALDGAFDSVPERLTFIAAAARIADTLASDALISPLEGSMAMILPDLPFSRYSPYDCRSRSRVLVIS